MEENSNGPRKRDQGNVVISALTPPPLKDIGQAMAGGQQCAGLGRVELPLLLVQPGFPQEKSWGSLKIDEANFTMSSLRRYNN